MKQLEVTSMKQIKMNEVKNDLKQIIYKAN